MEFEWLASATPSRKLKGDDWTKAIDEQARLLARLRYSKTYTMARCEKDLAWSFGEKANWPISASKLKKVVAEAYRVVK